MCLKAFLVGHSYSEHDEARLVDGARHLGAAFQKINFLRDLAADFDRPRPQLLSRRRCRLLHRGAEGRHHRRHQNDLDIACSTLTLLPSSSRRAVVLAQGLFAELTRRLRETPASVLVTTRIRVPNPVKMRIAALAAAGRLPKEHE